MSAESHGQVIQLVHKRRHISSAGLTWSPDLLSTVPSTRPRDHGLYPWVRMHLVSTQSPFADKNSLEWHKLCLVMEDQPTAYVDFSTNARATSGLHFDLLVCRVLLYSSCYAYWIVHEQKFSGGRMLTGAKKYDGAKVPIHFRSWNEISLERKFPGKKVLRSECFLLGTWLPGAKCRDLRIRNFRSNQIFFFSYACHLP